jgi:hypothetical protein
VGDVVCALATFAVGASAKRTFTVQNDRGAFPTAGLQYVRLQDKMTLAGGTSAFCPLADKTTSRLGSSPEISSSLKPSFKRSISHHINVLELYAFEAASPVNPLLHDLNIFFVQFYADAVSPQHPAR